jgi:hypothetical protein
MIDVNATEIAVKRAAESAGGEVWKVGASDKSDAIYINIRKPKTMTAGWNEATHAWDGAPVVDEFWNVLVRVSNHFNDTNTHERIFADLFVNIYEADEAEGLIADVVAFLSSAECANSDVHVTDTDCAQLHQT